MCYFDALSKDIYNFADSNHLTIWCYQPLKIWGLMVEGIQCRVCVTAKYSQGKEIVTLLLSIVACSSKKSQCLVIVAVGLYILFPDLFNKPLVLVLSYFCHICFVILQYIIDFHLF